MRPFIFINVAASADGKISNEKKEQVKISSQEDFERVDRLRASCDAIMVGIGTVLADDPTLTVKDEKLREERLKRGLPANPIRVVVDSRCRIPAHAEILNDEAKTIVAVSELADPEKVSEMGKKADIIVTGKKKVNLRNLAEKLYEMGIRRLMVEGGGTLNSGLLHEGIVDEIWIYYGDILIGGRDSPTPVDGTSFNPPIKLKLLKMKRLGSGILTRWKIS